MLEENLVDRIAKLERQMQETILSLQQNSSSDTVNASRVRGAVNKAKTYSVNLSEKELIDSYHNSPQLLSFVAITVALTSDTYQKTTNAEIYFEKASNGNYWLIANNENFYWLLPKDGIRLNNQAMRTLQRIFECEAYEITKNKFFSIVRAAKVTLNTSEKQWQLDELGKLDFSDNSNVAQLKAELKYLHEEREKMQLKLAKSEQDLRQVKSQLIELNKSHQQYVHLFDDRLKSLQSELRKVVQKNQEINSFLEQKQIAKKDSASLHNKLSVNEYLCEVVVDDDIINANINLSSLLANQNDNSSFKDWQNMKLEYNLNKHINTAYCLAISPLKDNKNGRLIASGGFDKMIHIWNLDTGEHIDSFLQSARVNDLCFSPIADDLMLISAMDNHIINLHRLSSATSIHTSLTDHLDRVSAIAISPNGKLLISGSADASLKIWNWESLECLYTLDTDYKNVLNIVFHPDSQHFISCHGDCTIKQWDAKTGALITTLVQNNNLIWKTAMSPNGQILAYADGNGQIVLIDLQTNSKQLIAEAYEKNVYAITFHPNNRILAYAGSDKLIKLLDIETRQNTCISPREMSHKNDVYGLIFSEDGQKLVSCSRDQTVKVWIPSQELNFFDLKL